MTGIAGGFDREKGWPAWVEEEGCLTW